MRRTTRATVSIAASFALIFLGLGLVAGPAAASPADDEQLFVVMINQLRADQGLPLLAIDNELKSAAGSWTSVMASTDQLAHTADMAAGISAPWIVLGENVGVHEIHDVGQLFNAFVNSPSHYENLIDPRFRYIGVSVVHSPNGKLWTTHRFMATTGEAVVTAPETEPSKKLAPEPAVSSSDRPEIPAEPLDATDAGEESKVAPLQPHRLRASYWKTRDRAILDLVHSLW